jgi:DNA-directed RNA polymerase specialized sigma24 family protein
VYGAVAPRVDAVCARILGAGPDAEDAAQRALTRVFERVDTFDPARGSALGWILTTTALQARTVRRERGRRAAREVAEVELATPCADDAREELLALIAPLDAVDRQTILAAIGDLPRPDAPPATFRKRLQRALDRVRRRMLDLGER